MHPKASCPSISGAGILAGDLVAVSIGLELPGSQRYAFTRGTVLGTENAARQVEKLGAAAHDRSHLFIGIGRAELNRTEFFQVPAPLLLPCLLHWASITSTCFTIFAAWTLPRPPPGLTLCIGAALLLRHCC
jgi:hypothetical protein